MAVNTHQVALDRRAAVIQGVKDNVTSIHNVSDLRPFKRVVLIGEPGMGKSAALAREAQETETEKINVRTLVNSPAATRFLGRAHLDGLDEYRSDGFAADKANFLAAALSEKCPDGWILSCRSQDWRKDADLNAINELYGASDSIVVAKLLPLEKHEAILILSSVGETNANRFYEEGLKKGAQAFLGNPLSLTLLQKVVTTKGEWPETRYEVFDASTNLLCHENNENRRFHHVKSASDILSAAEELCALLLVTGARAFWTTNAVPLGGHDATEFIKIGDVRLERTLIDQALDTPLFTGEGEVFEPIHRSIAEFLAARFLARKAVGARHSPAVPLSRVLALICSSDQKSPTELRGIYAWLAAHLEREGRPEFATVLCDRDPLTVVAYGDAAAFSTSIREKLLFSLDRDDPYFRSHSEGDTALNTLAGDDLATSFQAIINGERGTGHALVTVYDILMTGRPVLSLRPFLRATALDPQRAEWERCRVFDAWMNGEEQPQTAMRELFDELATEPSSNGRESLRARIAAGLDEEHLTSADVRSIFGDYEKSEVTNTIGRFSSLVQRLEKHPLLDMFEVPTKKWRPESKDPSKDIEITYDLDRILAANIRFHGELNAETLWRWLGNADHDQWSSSPNESKKAIAAWFEKCPSNESALFVEAVNSAFTDKGPWIPYVTFVKTTGRIPSETCIEKLISPWTTLNEQHSFITKSWANVRAFCLKLTSLASRTSEAEKSIGDADKRLLASVAEACRRMNNPSPVYWRAYSAVQAALGEGEILSRLTICEIPEYIGRQAENKAKRALRAEQEKAKRLDDWASHHSLLRSGEGNLAHAASVYFGFVDGMGRKWSTRNLEEYFNAEIATSIIIGFKRRAEIGLSVPVTELGRLRAKQSRNHMETAICAAVSILLQEGSEQALDELSLETAILVLLNSSFCEDEEHHSQLKGWGLRKLDRECERASDLLVGYWLDELNSRIALEQCEDSLEIGLIHDFSHGEARSKSASMALSKLLAKRRDFPPKVSRSLVLAILHQWDAEKILATCNAVVLDGDVSKEGRQMWAVVAFAMTPTEYSDKFHSLFGNDGKALVGLSDVVEAVTESFALGGTKEKVVYHSSIIEVLGSIFEPSREMFGPQNTVQGSINKLAEITDREAQKAIDRLHKLPSLVKWEGNLRHALSNNLRNIRDGTFSHPNMKQVIDALAGGPPVNANDLRAVMVEVLREYQRTIVHGDLPAWNGYWNTDANGKAVDPKIENICRDQVLNIVRPTLKQFSVDLTLSEAQRSGGRRADILLATGEGRNLPIEAKRHHNKELWTAISGQLQDYADDPLADGFGIYLVFWFGLSAGALPKAPAGVGTPSSPVELEQALVETMTSEQKNRFDVIVLDVSSSQKSST